MPRRFAVAALLVLGFVVPLLSPLIQLISCRSWSAWTEWDRLLVLAGNTAGLCGLTLLLAVPPGLVLAILLFRTDLPARRFLRSTLGICLFVPLPLFALAWQSLGGGWRPWTQGLVFAAAVHAAAGLPWIVWLAGLGLTRVDPELEDDAATTLSGWQVLCRISLPRAAASIGLAIVLVALQSAGEITVTDMVVVRTFAEEVYTQFVVSTRNGLGRAIVIALPAVVAAAIAVGFLVSRWANQFAVQVPARTPRVWQLGKSRWPAFLLVAAVVGGYALVPLLSLLRQAGGGSDWTTRRLTLEIQRAAGLHWPMLLESVVWAVAAGMICAWLALAASRLAVDRAAFRWLLFALTAALWAVPGPVIGFGLKETIEWLMDVEDVLLAWTSLRPIRLMLYELSTPAPVLWAHVLRLFPYAVALIWPAVRDVPRDLRETVRMDGAGDWGEFRHVIWPAVRGAFWVAVIAVAALALGELAASKLVQVPGRQTFVQELFNQMHYGATATTAALALTLLLPFFAVWPILAAGWRSRLSLSIQRGESPSRH
jgi:iron(III) transport system permease protein